MNARHHARRPREFAPRARGRMQGRGAWALGIVLLFGVATPALANGGKLRLADVPVGPFLLAVFTNPTPVTPDSIDVSVLVSDPKTGQPVADLVVNVFAEPIDHEGRRLVRPATRDQADNPERYYAAKFSPGSEGRWRFTVHASGVVDGAAVEGEGSFELTVRSRNLLDQPLVLAIALLLPLGLVSLWLMSSRSSGPAEQAVALLAVLWISGCTLVAPAPPGPIGTRVDSAAPNGVPTASRSEPRSRYGNPSSYEVNGRRYTVMDSARGYQEVGLASWYGEPFHGRRTSSGETFDMFKMTAAHRSLPLPTWARVTNLDNQLSVIVRINDRGPFHDERLIDLAYAAAVALQMIGPGTARVEVRALDPDSLPPVPDRVLLADSIRLAVRSPAQH